jgi:phosphatidylinositol-bisphosphatase
VILGFQEVDLSAEAFLLNDSSREAFWSSAVENCLSKSSRGYRKIATKQLVGMLLLIYLRADWEKHASRVFTDTAGCGILGMMGNKGAVAARFQLFDSVICLVNSHLAADSKDVERRNQDYAEICRRLSFHDERFQESHSIWDCEYVLLASFVDIRSHLIWLGDLNYRVGLPESDVKRLLRQNQIEKLLQNDQVYLTMILAISSSKLNAERRAGRAFAEFDEGPIDFTPR